MEQNTAAALAQNSHRIEAMENATSTKLDSLQSQVNLVASSSAESTAKVSSMEDLIKALATGQQGLQDTCGKIGNAMEHMRDEMLRMNLKRTAADSSEQQGPPAGR